MKVYIIGRLTRDGLTLDFDYPVLHTDREEAIRDVQQRNKYPPATWTIAEEVLHT